MPVIDQPGGNANAGISAGVNERPVKAYPWTCTNPGCPSPAQIGRIEEGCQACGAGADATAGSPLPPTDYNCQACRGTGTVERKCGACEGTGMTEAPQLGEPPPSCDKCGGSGSVALGCGRCDGSGIDPAPAQKPVASAEETSPRPVAPSAAAAPALPKPSAQAGIFGAAVPDLTAHAKGLPSIDEEPPVTRPDTVVRYRLIRYEGPAAEIERTMSRSLTGGRRWPNGNTIAAIEIAEPKGGVREVLRQAAAIAEGEWPGKDSY